MTSEAVQRPSSQPKRSPEWHIYLCGGRAAVRKRDGGEADALVLDVLRLVGGVGGAHEVRHAVVAQDLDVVLV